MKAYWYSVIMVCVIMADRLSKQYMLTADDVQIFPWLYFSTTFNRGISWGMLNSTQTMPFVLLTLIIGCFVGVLMYYTWVRYKQHFSILAEVLVISGALSNLFDRVCYHGVLDFIMISYNNWSWPSFNIADSAIVVGALFMIVSTVKELYELHT